VRTVIEIEHMRAALVIPAQFTPASGNNDPDTCSRSCFQNEVGHTPWVVYDDTAEADVERLISQTQKACQVFWRCIQRLRAQEKPADVLCDLSAHEMIPRIVTPYQCCVPSHGASEPEMATNSTCTESSEFPRSRGPNWTTTVPSPGL
jgi:hypothetical protein